MNTLEEKIRALPPELQKEVGDFIEFLLSKRRQRPRRKPEFVWAGALKDLASHYTSVELQHEASAWRLGEK